MRKLLASSFMALLASCGGGGGDAPAAPALPMPIIGIEGDSLATQQYGLWPSMLAAQIPGKYTNNSHEGRASAESVALYDGAFKGRKGDFFILVVGTNDANNQNAPLTFANIRAIWAKARADGYKVIAFTVSNQRDFYPGFVVAQDFREKINAAIRGASSEYDALIEPDVLLPDADDKTAYVDTVHFAPRGAKVVADAITASIGRLRISK